MEQNKMQTRLENSYIQRGSGEPTAIWTGNDANDDSDGHKNQRIPTKMPTTDIENWPSIITTLVYATWRYSQRQIK